ncbi:zinc finger protein 91-like [Oppia nitens]|uniref:zinc finger protein 91-like n=1 Tax=Oppia nitens TaxID=1686743 RepID=UPI0023DA4572|nr:zinc finger protein 91-like [Oppia nitens]
MTSMVVTIDDILDQLWSENKRLLKELLFANKFKTILLKLFDKYEEHIDREDKHEFKQLQEVMKNEIQLKDKEIEENSHIVDQKACDNDCQFYRSKTRSGLNLCKIGSARDDSGFETEELNTNNECYDSTTDSYICPQNNCHKSFNNSKKFLTHCNSCKPSKNINKKYIYDKITRKLNCRYENCDKMFAVISALWKHEKLYHEMDKTKKLKCHYTDCQFKCLFNSQLKQHVNNKHLNIISNSFICPISGCNKSLKTKNNLNQHLLIHTNTLVRCDFDGCHRQFRNRTQLTVHMAQHKSEPTLKCSVKGCLEKFFNERERYRHRKLVHKYKRVIVLYKKRCVWPGCDYFGNRLTTHMEVHTGLRRHECLWPQCGKRFRSSTALQNHMNIHNNVKPYQCRWPGCDYRSANNPNILKHMKQVHQKQ